MFLFVVCKSDNNHTLDSDKYSCTVYMSCFWHIQSLVACHMLDEIFNALYHCVSEQKFSAL